MTEKTPYRMNQIPQHVLKRMLDMSLTEPHRLSPAELTLAKRICYCVFCEKVWMARKKKKPLRCEGCKRTGWDMPLLQKILAVERSQNTPPPETETKETTETKRRANDHNS